MTTIAQFAHEHLDEIAREYDMTAEAARRNADSDLGLEPFDIDVALSALPDYRSGNHVRMPMMARRAMLAVMNTHLGVSLAFGEQEQSIAFSDGEWLCHICIRIGNHGQTAAELYINSSSSHDFTVAHGNCSNCGEGYCDCGCRPYCDWCQTGGHEIDDHDSVRNCDNCERLYDCADADDPENEFCDGCYEPDEDNYDSDGWISASNGTCCEEDGEFDGEWSSILPVNSPALVGVAT